MGRMFGTDGVRGVANQDVTAELALGLSVAAARVLVEAGEVSADHERPPAHWPRLSLPTLFAYIYVYMLMSPKGRKVNREAIVLTD